MDLGSTPLTPMYCIAIVGVTLLSVVTRATLVPITQLVQFTEMTSPREEFTYFIAK
jgi:hypothetical protein